MSTDLSMYFGEKPQDPRVSEMMLQADQEPSQLPMKRQRGSQRPDVTRKRKMRRNSGAHGQEGYDRSTDWDLYHPGDKYPDARIHRTIHTYPSFELWKRMGDKSVPDHEIAHEVLQHVSKHPNLGLHWTSSEGHAYRVAGYPGWGQGRSWYSDQDREHAEPESDLGATVIVHAKWPQKEHIETDPHILKKYDVKAYDDPDALAEEEEVPVKTGSPLEVTGISWTQYGGSNRRGDYRHHSFEKPISRQGTLLNTQVERLNQGDQIRTPTGQSVKVHKVRPHETDSSLLYLDTDQGTSTVKRGTDFQTVPANNQQQELPGIGNQMNSGNSGQLPMSGRTPAGPAAGTNSEPGASTPCPNCHNLGTLHARGDVYICSVCGYTIAAGGSPGGLLFSNAPTGHVAPRRKPGEVPRAHVWGSLASLMEEF